MLSLSLPAVMRSVDSANADKRSFPRLPTQVGARFSLRKVDRTQQRYLDGVIKNVSYGGICLRARRTAPPGTVLKIEFWIRDGDHRGQRILASGMVRWRKRGWFGVGAMGVEFVDFEGLGATELRQWLQQLRGGRTARPHDGPHG